MIHIATVHYKTDKWIDVQLKYLKENVKQPFRVYACLCGDAYKHKEKFFFSTNPEIKSHGEKLNLLAQQIMSIAEKEDTLLFIDGDAFPISPIDEYIENSLEKHSLVAIQRLENLHEIIPHPSFCFTTVGFWESIAGDWTRGYKWKTIEGDYVTEVGSNLLKILEDKKIEWGKIHRSSENTYHPVFFGTYGGLVYHHGAGFHKPFSKSDRNINVDSLYKSWILIKTIRIILRLLSLKNRYRFCNQFGITQKVVEHNQIASDIVYNMIKQGKWVFN